MCIVPPSTDRSSLTAVGNLDQTFRDSLLTDTAIANSSGAKQGVLSARNRSRSAGALVASPNSDQQVTSAQLAQHSTEDDCWLVVKGKVNIFFRQYTFNNVLCTYLTQYTACRFTMSQAGLNSTPGGVSLPLMLAKMPLMCLHAFMQQHPGPN